MKNYAYKALKPTGEMVEGVFEGSHERELNEYFIAQELTPVKVTAQRASSPTGIWHDLQLSLSRRLLESELIAFPRQFAAAYGAGIAVPRILELLREQTKHERFAEALK